MSNRRLLFALLVAWGILIAYGSQTAKRKAGTNEGRAAIAAAVIVVLALGLLGEVAPGFAVGFAALLVLAALLAGPGNSFLTLTKTIPQNLLKGAS